VDKNILTINGTNKMFQKLQKTNKRTRNISKNKANILAV